jgi:tetratricopeptide (TPR) repeat protein
VSRRGGAAPGVGVWLWLATAACTVPVVQPLPERQDPARFEACDQPAAQAAYKQALVHLQAGEDEAALPLLRSVVGVCKENVVAHCRYQDVALRLGGAAEAAMREFYASIEPVRNSPVPGYVQARLLDSKFERKQVLDRLLAAYDGFAYGWLSMGRLNRSVGKLTEAARCLRRAVARHPGLAEAWLELAEVKVEQGAAGSSRRDYENYLAVRPNDLDVVRAYAHVQLYQLGDVKAARPWLEKLLAVDPLDVGVMMDLAAADWLANRFEDALEGYLAVLRLRPDQARAALNIGHLHYDAVPRNEDQRREHWPKAHAAYTLYLQLARSEEGLDHFEESLAVPYRLKVIEEFLGPIDASPTTLDSLR